jgi:hypothetical protein
VQSDGLVAGSFTYSIVAPNVSTSGSINFIAGACSYVDPSTVSDAGSCRKAQELCSNDCCSGLSCDSSSHQCCAAVQAVCTTASDCCLPPLGAQPGCSAAGKCCLSNGPTSLAPCADDGDCCSGTCIAGGIGKHCQ